MTINPKQAQEHKISFQALNAITEWEQLKLILIDFAKTQDSHSATILGYIKALSQNQRGFWVEFGNQAGFISDVMYSKTQKKVTIEYVDAEGNPGVIPSSQTDVKVYFRG